MKSHSDRCVDWRIFLITFVVSLTFACATLPPAQSIRDLKDISGKWEAKVSPSSYPEDGLYGGTASSTGVIQPLQLTLLINEDGTYKWNTSPGRSGVGMGQLSEGKFRIQSRGWIVGVCTLHEGSGKRGLDCKSDDAKVGIQYVPTSR